MYTAREVQTILLAVELEQVMMQLEYEGKATSRLALQDDGTYARLYTLIDEDEAKEEL